MSETVDARFTDEEKHLAQKCGEAFRQLLRAHQRYEGAKNLYRRAREKCLDAGLEVGMRADILEGGLDINAEDLSITKEVIARSEYNRDD